MSAIVISENANIVYDAFTESLYTMLFIFINGPLKLFLEIKEGKTSIKKLVEDYEDERSLVHQKLLGMKKPDLLPTKDESKPIKRRNATST